VENSGLNVKVGTVVEITREESRQIDMLARSMSSLARSQKKGWLLPFVQAHTQLSRIIHAAVTRSHAS